MRWVTCRHLRFKVTCRSRMVALNRSMKAVLRTVTLFHNFGALADFGRKVIKERTHAGLQAARARGRLSGRPKIQSLDPKKIAHARTLYSDRHMTVQEIRET